VRTSHIGVGIAAIGAHGEAAVGDNLAMSPDRIAAILSATFTVA